jgi:hypothetical protein
MVFDAFGADLQDCGDLPGVPVFGDELDNVALAARQLFERLFWLTIPLNKGSLLRSRVEIFWRSSTSL